MNITITNTTASDVYVYNFGYGNPATVAPLGNGPLCSQASLQLSLTSATQMRIYVAADRLQNSLESTSNPCAPDPFNSNIDGIVLYSFAEYTYDATAAQYTIDVSYINEYSFPLTLTFTDVPKDVAAQANFEYGFTSLAAVKTQLMAQTDYAWSALIWPHNPQTQWQPYYPTGMNRIIGPLNAWSQQQATPAIGPWEPNSYQAFISSLPYDGTQLFSSSTNLDGWNQLISEPTNTGYVQALHAAAIADSSGKYGFFCYPNDNTNGQFTDLPTTVGCTLKIYSFSG